MYMYNEKIGGMKEEREKVQLLLSINKQAIGRQGENKEKGGKGILFYNATEAKN
jgi:hypothetical protein